MRSRDEIEGDLQFTDVSRAEKVICELLLDIRDIAEQTRGCVIDVETAVEQGLKRVSSDILHK